MMSFKPRYLPAPLAATLGLAHAAEPVLIRNARGLTLDAHGHLAYTAEDRR